MPVARAANVIQCKHHRLRRNACEWSTAGIISGCKTRARARESERFIQEGNRAPGLKAPRDKSNPEPDVPCPAASTQLCQPSCPTQHAPAPIHRPHPPCAPDAARPSLTTTSIAPRFPWPGPGLDLVRHRPHHRRGQNRSRERVRPAQPPPENRVRERKRGRERERGEIEKGREGGREGGTERERASEHKHA